MSRMNKVVAVLLVTLFAGIALAAGVGSFKVVDIVLTPDAGGGVTFANGTRQVTAYTGQLTPPNGVQGAVQWASDGGFNGVPELVFTAGTDGGQLTIQQRGGASAGGTLPGLRLENPDVAAAGVQQYSPTLDFIGSGWGTAAPGAQAVKWRVVNVPVQGTAAPSGTFTVQSSIGGGAYTDRFTVTSAGVVTATSFVSGSSTWGANPSTGGMLTGAILQVTASATMYGYGTAMQTLLTRTTSATVGAIPICTDLTNTNCANNGTTGILAANSCVQVKAMCTAVDEADVARHNSYEIENTCCNKAGTVTCDTETSIRAVEAVAGWGLTIVPCDTAVGACSYADKPVIEVTGEAAVNVRWKCFNATFITYSNAYPTP